jgi:hypothetical protein
MMKKREAVSGLKINSFLLDLSGWVVTLGFLFAFMDKRTAVETSAAIAIVEFAFIAWRAWQQRRMAAHYNGPSSN